MEVLGVHEAPEEHQAGAGMGGARCFRYQPILNRIQCNRPRRAWGSTVPHCRRHLDHPPWGARGAKVMNPVHLASKPLQPQQSRALDWVRRLRSMG